MDPALHRPTHGVRKYQIARPHSATNQAVEIQTSTSSRFIRPAPRKTPLGTYREAPMPSARRTTEQEERRWRGAADRVARHSRARTLPSPLVSLVWMRQRSFMVEHAAKVLAIDPTAASLAFHEVIGVVAIATNPYADELATLDCPIFDEIVRHFGHSHFGCAGRARRSGTAAGTGT